jgi:ribosomal protein S18 acetylase RimI-like enzyme
MEKYQVRRAVASDQKWVAKLFDLNKEILGKVGGGLVFWRWLQGNNPREHFFVIPEIAFMHWLQRAKDGTSVIYEIAVHPEHKKKGLGKQLINTLSGAIELKTDAEHAESNEFYKKLGFVLIGYKTASSGKKLAIYKKW